MLTSDQASCLLKSRHGETAANVEKRFKGAVSTKELWVCLGEQRNSGSRGTGSREEQKNIR